MKKITLMLLLISFFIGAAIYVISYVNAREYIFSMNVQEYEHYRNTYDDEELPCYMDEIFHDYEYAHANEYFK